LSASLPLSRCGSGGLIGIDFGHAFGSATQFLGIPELMPFRMTRFLFSVKVCFELTLNDLRQLVSVFKPHSVDGIIKSTMIYTLKALQVRVCVRM
jgi:DNA-dependent protein kinase catalytic subunit